MSKRKSKSFRIYSIFFDDKNQQKRWFVVFSVFLPLILTIVFSVWGTVISLKSYNFSVEASKNREQIDSMKVMINGINKQNKLLIDQNSMINEQVGELRKMVLLSENSNKVQGMHLSTVLDGINESKVPKLAIEEVLDELGAGKDADFAQYSGVKIINHGGEIYNLRYKELDTIAINPADLPENGFIPRNSNLELSFTNLFLNVSKKKLRIRFSFQDGLNRNYYEDLVIIDNKDGIEFQLGKMIKL